jgi:hypothetical protein
MLKNCNYSGEGRVLVPAVDQVGGVSDQLVKVFRGQDAGLDVLSRLLEYRNQGGRGFDHQRYGGIDRFAGVDGCGNRHTQPLANGRGGFGVQGAVSAHSADQRGVGDANFTGGFAVGQLPALDFGFQQGLKHAPMITRFAEQANAPKPFLQPYRGNC